MADPTDHTIRRSKPPSRWDTGPKKTTTVTPKDQTELVPVEWYEKWLAQQDLGKNEARAKRGGGKGTRPAVQNPLMSFEVTTSGIRDTLVSLAASMTMNAVAAQNALLASARRIQAQARSNIRPYTYEGRLHDAITVRVSGKSSSHMVRVTVGIQARTFAPEGATFERGWKSEKGLHPPADAFVDWVVRRGLASDLREASSMAFGISRRMGERGGYSFGTRPWLGPAFAAEQGAVQPTVERYMLSTWGKQVRGPGGQFLG